MRNWKSSLIVVRLVWIFTYVDTVYTKGNSCNTIKYEQKLIENSGEYKFR